MTSLIIAAGVLLLGWNAAAGTEKILGGYYATEKWGMDKLPVGKIDFTTYNFIFQAFLKAKEDGSPILVPGRYPCTSLVTLAHQNGVKVIISLGGGSYKLFPSMFSLLKVLVIMLPVEWPVAAGGCFCAVSAFLSFMSR